MTKKKTAAFRIIPLLFVLLLTLPFRMPAVSADDTELLGELPGRWIFYAYGEEQADGETPLLDLAYLTLNEDGTLTLNCYGRDGEYICTYGGGWSFELVTGGMDRLTMLFFRTDGGASNVECAWSVYAEGWDENDAHHMFLALEDEECSGVSPFEELYGEEGKWPVGLEKTEGPNMQVYNCREFVSLRDERSTSSKRLAKVPLGAYVLAFPEAGEKNGFILCMYGGEYGYILSEYLRPAETCLCAACGAVYEAGAGLKTCPGCGAALRD